MSELNEVTSIIFLASLGLPLYAALRPSAKYAEIAALPPFPNVNNVLPVLIFPFRSMEISASISLEQDELLRDSSSKPQ
jgi:hypothetical protein